MCRLEVASPHAIDPSHHRFAILPSQTEKAPTRILHAVDISEGPIEARRAGAPRLPGEEEALLVVDKTDHVFAVTAKAKTRTG